MPFVYVKSAKVLNLIPNPTDLYIDFFRVLAKTDMNRRTSSLKTVPSKLAVYGKIRGRRMSRMKKSKFTEEPIAFALRQAEAGTRVIEVCRKMGISEQTFFRWK